MTTPLHMQKPRGLTPRPFRLGVDSGDWGEPRDRYFGSLDAALAAGAAYPEKYHPFIWITERRATPGNPRGRHNNVTHVKDGKRVTP